MRELRIVDVTDEATFAAVPPCADPSFDHRTCDYWEDADRGSKAHRAAWLAPVPPAPSQGGPARQAPANPFAPPPRSSANPFAPTARAVPANPFAIDDEATPDNPFAPRREPLPSPLAGPRKLGLLGRGLAIFGSYAKVLEVETGGEDRPAAYCQFGPLSAYPRALRLRQLYPQLPSAPLPAVITCVAVTDDARRRGLALRLVAAVCEDLAARGFAAVEAYPEANARPDATSAASPAFWVRAGFRIAVGDERFPVVRREL